MEITEFNHRQQVFLASLLKYRAQGQRSAVALAADDAGYNADHARAFLTNPHAKQFLAEQTAETIAEITKETRMTIADITAVYERIANFDPLKTVKVDKDGKIKARTIAEMDKDTRMCAGATLKDIRGAADSLSRIHGMFDDKLAVGVTFKDILDEVSKDDGSSEPLVKEG